MAKEYNVRILKCDVFSGDDFLVELEKPSELVFKAGQFLMVHHGEEERAFSIASAPSEKVVKILVRKHKGGVVSPYLCNKKKGGMVKISGPYGLFVVRGEEKEIIFIAAGTGVAPHRSMIIDSLENKIGRSATLIFGFRDILFFENEFRNLEKKYGNFKLHCCCSGEGKKGCLDGRVTEHLKKLIKTAKGKEVYITGPNKMMKSTRKVLREMGFRKDRVHVEVWD